MVEIELDGKKVEVAEGSMLMHAAEKAGNYIPHFCYHKKLSIAANCRMCLVDVEKMPKPVPACATPVSQGMIVRTKSIKAVNAQKSVMEFLLINHPLDCPICDQGGECQLQDLAVGYGSGASRYEEEKRVVHHKEVGPLISMEEMTRCIQCTRCVRFGQEVAGVMEFGMANRGEHSEIETFLGHSVDSELSGNMIDICPVGALTSKPFRYSARTWELSRRRSIASHDSSGANLIVQVKNNRVMRVVPLENEEVNECWIADRDRFSYEGLNSPDRLTTPMIKQGGVWNEVDWVAALDYIAHGLKSIKAHHGASAIGALVSPHSTVEELFLAKKIIDGIGSGNIDYRLRHADFSPSKGLRWLGTSIASLSQLQSVLVVGSNLRKDHPLFALRIREATKRGAKVNVINSQHQDWAMKLGEMVISSAADWGESLSAVATSVANQKGIASPFEAKQTQQSDEIAKSLLAKERSAILLGNGAAHHARSNEILFIANWIAEQTDSTCGYLTESANTVGAQWAGALPAAGGLDAKAMLSGGLKAAILLNVEPIFDSALGKDAIAGLEKCEMVVSMSPFKANMEFADVLLPISPSTETPGSFVNAEGRLQSFYSVVKPLAETRPAWKVFRVLGNMLNLPKLEYESSQEVLADLMKQGDVVFRLSNLCDKPAADSNTPAVSEPCVASIYQLDGVVRRSPALQQTADAQKTTSCCIAHRSKCEEVLA